MTNLDIQAAAEITAEALELFAAAALVKTAAERAAWNQLLQDHLGRVVTVGGLDAIDAHCEKFGLRYIPEPTWGRLTKEIAAECETYARRYVITLGESIREWEGDGPHGGFGLTVSQAAEVGAYFVDQGRELTEIPGRKTTAEGKL
jgi:hypothetical protein